MSSPSTNLESLGAARASDPSAAWRLSLALNGGVAMFVLAGSWHLAGGPSATPPPHRCQVLLMCVGAMLACAAWLAGTSLPGRWKILFIGFIMAAVTAAGIDSVVAFDQDEGMLRPGRFARGRFVHDGQGLSCAVFPNCRLKTRPFLRNAGGQEAAPPAPKNRSRLRFDESAVFLQMAAEQAKSAAGSSSNWLITVSGAPVRFWNYNIVAQAIVTEESHCITRPGTKLLTPTRITRVDGMDRAEFELLLEPEHVYARHVFARSGNYLVHIEIDTTNEDDRRLFDEFVSSLRITRTPTTFDALSCLF